ncbi:MAG: murein hydrolase activator EnvC family protein [Pseudomonadota bacterium]
MASARSIALACPVAASIAALAPHDLALAGQAPQKQLEAVREALDSAQDRSKALEAEEAALATQVQDLARRLVETAAKVQRQEDSLTRIEMEIDALNQEERRLAQALAARQAQLAETLAALQMLSRQPPHLVLLRPASATQTARSAALLNQVMPEIRAQAAGVRAELDTLATVRAELDARRTRQRIELAALETTRVELDRLREERTKRRAEVSDLARAERARIAALVRQSRTLEELLAKLEAERQRLAAVPSPIPRPQARPGASRPFSKARGALPLPARGDILIGFGDKTEEGAAKGLSILTRDAATVVAPYDGTIVYADRFRSYGQLLIIEHGEGYHSVLAGMIRLDGSVGQWVLTGEPVGEMGRADAAQKQTGNPAGRPVLYVELQRDGKPINPLPWLSAKLERVSP